MTNVFKTGFGRFVCDGDQITAEVDGFSLIAWTEQDDSWAAPDERQDGFWPNTTDPESAGYVKKGAYPRAMMIARRVMDAWKNDEWDYCGVCVAVERQGVRLTHGCDNAMWGVERNYPTFCKGEFPNDHLRDVANYLAGEALEAARQKLKTLCEMC